MQVRCAVIGEDSSCQCESNMHIYIGVSWPLETLAPLGCHLSVLWTNQNQPVFVYVLYMGGYCKRTIILACALILNGRVKHPPALMYAVMFYVILNKRKRLGDCVTFFTLEGDTMQRLNALT